MVARPSVVQVGPKKEGRYVKKFELRGVHFDIDDNLRKYVTKKIGSLDRLLSQHTKESAHTEVSLKETNAKSGKQCICEVTMHLPHETIQLEESTINMYAAIDIVEAKLKMQMKKYKDAHDRGKIQRRLFARLRSQEA